MDSILIVALVVLPGWVSITCSQLYNPRETERAALMQWGMLVYHAAVVHMFITALIVLSVIIWPGFFLDTLDVDFAVTDGISAYLKKLPTIGSTTMFVYVLVLVVASLISGIADVPLKLVSGVGTLARIVKLSDNPVSDVPLWYRAWEIDRELFRQDLEAVSSTRDTVEVGIQMLVRMKNGDVYVGKLHEYQLKSDEGNSKDIMLGGEIILWPSGDSSEEIVLSFDQGSGGTLINSENISSIEYLYFTEDQD